VPIDNLDEFAARRLHSMVANWRCRPVAAGRNFRASERCAAGAVTQKLLRDWLIYANVWPFIIGHVSQHH